MKCSTMMAILCCGALALAVTGCRYDDAADPNDVGGGSQDVVTETLPSNDLFGELNTIRDEAFTAFIRGERSLDTWDDFVQEWLNAGGQTLTDEANAWYAAQ